MSAMGQLSPKAAPGHDQPFAKHLVTDRFMRIADI